jgi:hypothetical protein
MILRGRNMNINQVADDKSDDLVPEKLGLGARLMIFVWQSPMMLMSWSWVTFLLALTIYICTPFIQHQPWGAGHKVSIDKVQRHGNACSLFNQDRVLLSLLRCSTSCSFRGQFCVRLPYSRRGGPDHDCRHRNEGSAISLAEG